MSDYAKIELILQVSENSDFSRPYVELQPRPGSSSLAPTEAGIFKVIAATTPGTEANTEQYGAAPYVVVANRSAVSVTCTYTNSADSANSLIIAAGKFVVIPDLKTATNLTLIAASSTALCQVAVIGA